MNNEAQTSSSILVKRTSQYANRLRAINIFVDGQKIGSVKNGETKEFAISPGSHDIFAQIDWCKSPKIQIHVSPDKKETLFCGSEIRGWKIVLTLLYLFMPRKWIYLKKEEL